MLNAEKGGIASITSSHVPATKRVNFILSEKAYRDLNNLATETSRTMTDLMRLGLGLIKVALEAERKGHHLIVANAEGEAIKEIVLPF